MATKPTKRKLNLATYVKRRNGVPLGSSGSLTNMLYGSLGAGSFAGFWRYWNPIWGYYLGRFIFAPIRLRSPQALATIMTFVVSGALHDAVISALFSNFIFVCTPWFLAMGMLVVVTEKCNISYTDYAWTVRAIINIACVGLPLLLVFAAKNILV